MTELRRKNLFHLKIINEQSMEMTSNSCNTGTSALSDMYALTLGHCALRRCAYISGNAQEPVLQLIYYTFHTLKICPNLLLTELPIYITTDNNFDYGIHSNVSVMFI